MSSSCTSAAANDGVWDLGSARASLRHVARHDKLGLHPWLVVVGAHVLFDLELDAIPARRQVRRIEPALNTKGSLGQRGRPVAVNVHVAREQWSAIAAYRDDEYRLRQIPQSLPRRAHGER